MGEVVGILEIGFLDPHLRSPGEYEGLLFKKLKEIFLWTAN
jgi:hypothetical protein